MLRKIFLLICFLFTIIQYSNATSFTVDGFSYVVISEKDKEVSLHNSQELYGELILPSTVEYNNTEYTVSQLGISALKEQAITKIIIPKTYKEICHSAFYNCKQLKEVIFLESTEELLVRDNYYKQKATFGDCPVEYVEIHRPIKAPNMGLFHNCPIKKIIFQHIEEIPNGLYFGNPLLNEVYLCDGIKNIPNACFTNSSSLTDIHLPSSIEIIGNYAFSGCVGLEEIIIPQNVKEIGNYAFSGCSSLQSINLENVETIGARAFNKCVSLQNFTLNKCRKIGSCAFYGCTSLTKMIYPEGFTQISNGDLFECPNITYVEFPSTLLKIGDEYNVSGSFTSCKDIDTIVCKAQIPPLIDDTFAFSSTQMSNAILIIPKGTFDKYISDIFWSKFLEIKEQEFTQTSIDDKSFTTTYIYVNGERISIPSRNNSIIVYDAQGKLLYNLLESKSIHLPIGNYLFKSNKTTIKHFIR